MFLDLAGTSHHFGSDSGWLKKHGPQPILTQSIISVVIARTMYVWSKSRHRTRLNTVEILNSFRWTVYPEQLHHGPGCRSEGLYPHHVSTWSSSDFSPFQYPTWVLSTKHWNYWRRGRDGRDGPPGCSCQSAGAMTGSPCDCHIYIVLWGLQYHSSLQSSVYRLTWLC